MKLKILYILIPLIITSSCSSVSKNTKANQNPELTLQTIAAFKSAEQINEQNWQLIFRKLDDCQYILFLADLEKLNSLKDNLVIPADNTFSANPDFINSMFRINYTEENSPDQATGENAVINRLKEVRRYPGDRFAAAGFEDDTSPDDFILSLKKNVSSDSADEIAKMISFPLDAVIRKKRLKIKDPDAFVKNYNNIFNKRVKNAVLSQPLADVQASPKGLIIGTGEIVIKRFDDKIFITSINSY
jgi:hypothetical protein